MANASSYKSSDSLLWICVLVVPLGGYLISHMITMSIGVSLFSLGKPIVWLSICLVVSLIITMINGIIVGNKQNKVFRSYIAFCCIIIFCTIIHLPYVTVGSRYVYIGFLCYVFSFLAFNIYARRCMVTSKLAVAVWLLFAIMVFVFMSTRAAFLSIYDNEKVLSSSYLILYMFPIIMLVSNKRMGVLCALIVFISLLLSNKRGAFITGSISIILYFFIDFVFIFSNSKKRIWSAVIALVAIIVGYFYFSELIEERGLFMVDRISSISSDEGSGRTEVWKEVLAGIRESSPVELLGGHGLETTRNVNHHGLTAHNDFMEIIYDFGIIAFVFYLLLIYRLVSHSVSLIKNKSRLSPAFCSSAFLFTIPAFFSHIVIYPQYFLLFSMFWGFVMGIEDNPNFSVDYLSNKNR